MPHGLHVFHQGVRMQASLVVIASEQSGIQDILRPPRTAPHHPGHRIHGGASQKPPPEGEQQRLHEPFRVTTGNPLSCPHTHPLSLGSRSRRGT